MMLYLFVVMVMLLNILIAQLSDIYDFIRRGADTEVQITKAWVVCRVELNTFHSVCFRKVSVLNVLFKKFQLQRKVSI